MADEIGIEVYPPLPVMNSKIKSSEGINKFEMSIIIIESTAFICIMGILIASLTQNRLQNSGIWEMELWKWCLLILAILCGRLIAFLITEVAVFLIPYCKWVNKRVLYFAYGVKKSVLVFIWLSLITLIWGLLFQYQSHESKRIIHHITKGLIGGLIGTAIWLVKDFFIVVVGSVHATKLFEKINDAITNQKAICDISSMEKSPCPTEISILKEQVKTIRGKKLDHLSYINRNNDSKHTEITSEKEAKEAANLIFKNLGAKPIEVNHELDAKDGSRTELDAEDGSRTELDAEDGSDTEDEPKWYLDLEKLLEFVTDANLEKQFTESAEAIQNTGINQAGTQKKHIKKSVFRHWLVDVYNEYESLRNTLEHSKTAIDDFQKVTSLITLILIIIVWLLFMEYLSTKTLVYVSGQFVLLAFIFGNTVKTVFEAVIFVFLIHPFDVGDRCVVDGVQMNVDEMKILSTTFLRYDGEKIYYPNSVLASKPISNLYRSPPMGDSVEFAVDLSTSMKDLRKLECRIKSYLRNNPRRWREDHSVQFKEIEDVNKMKVALYVGHTVNFHYAAKRGKRRSLLMKELKKILEELKIKYRLLPQEVHLKSI